MIDFLFWIGGGSVAVVAVFWIIYLVRRSSDFRRSLDFVFLQILIPKKESKEDVERDRDQTSEIRKVIGIGEHFFETIHGIYSRDIKNVFTDQDFLSLEYIATDGEIKFFYGVSKRAEAHCGKANY